MSEDATKKSYITLGLTAAAVIIIVLILWQTSEAINNNIDEINENGDEIEDELQSIKDDFVDLLTIYLGISCVAAIMALVLVKALGWSLDAKTLGWVSGIGIAAFIVLIVWTITQLSAWFAGIVLIYTLAVGAVFYLLGRYESNIRNFLRKTT